MATSGPSNRELMEKAEGRKSSTSDAAPSSPAPAVSDEFVPSDVAKQAMSSEPFDQAKVDSIKQAIQDGQYPLDSRRIAESFLAVERMIGG
jgi:negative regulator of flagellin synthesis FlgM